MNNKILQRLLFPFLFTALLFTACKKDNNGGSDTPPPADKTAVEITGFKFSPATLTIANGVTVTWTNNDTAPHTVTADDNSFTSGNLNQGDTYSHKFTAAGTVNYHCNIHPGMKASVTVQ